jgi:group I intron endonuclease
MGRYEEDYGGVVEPRKVYHLSEKGIGKHLKGKMWYDNKEKAGIYRWVNRINGKSYVGSSTNLGKRINSYFSGVTGGKLRLIISKAIEKYGLKNFTWEIWEYCDPSELREKEREYIDMFEPEYNINKGEKKVKKSNKPIIEQEQAEDGAEEEDDEQLDLTGSEGEWGNLVYVFEEVVGEPKDGDYGLEAECTGPLEYFSEDGVEECTSAGVYLTEAGDEEKKNKTLQRSEETKEKYPAKQSVREKHPAVGYKIEVEDVIENKTTIYTSYREAARALDMSVGIISRRINLKEQKKAYKGRYIFKGVNEETKDKQ